MGAGQQSEEGGLRRSGSGCGCVMVVLKGSI